MNKKDHKQLLNLLETHRTLFKNPFIGLADLDMNVLSISQEVLDKLAIVVSVKDYVRKSIFFKQQGDTPTLSKKRLEIHGEVVISQKAISWVGINTNHHNNYQILNYITKPIFSQDNNDVIGLWTEAHNLNSFSAPTLKKIIEPCIDIKSFNFDLNFNPLHLTPREHEIIFLLCNDYSPKEITAILSHKSAKKLSVNTIYHTINQRLVTKFGVFNTVQLINKAILFSYDKNIPISLLENSVFQLSEASAI